jgi:hypothetical protein
MGISLRVLVLELEDGYDFLEIWSGGGGGGDASGSAAPSDLPIARLTGSTLPCAGGVCEFSSRSSSMTVRLVSDSSVEFSGFEAEYQCGIGSRANALGPAGTKPPRRFSCQPPRHVGPVFNRTGVGTGTGMEPDATPCNRDGGEGKDPALQRRPPDPPRAASSDPVIGSASQLESEAWPEGFCGFLNLTQTSSPIIITDGPVKYAANARCVWRIVAESSIEFRFTMLRTEAGYDFVKLYDGLSTESPLLGAFSGADLPGLAASSVGRAMLSFNADASIHNDGFEVIVTSL